MTLSHRLRRTDSGRAGIYVCATCGSTDQRPATHKTWCSVRQQLRRFTAGKDLTGQAA